MKPYFRKMPRFIFVKEKTLINSHSIHIVMIPLDEDICQTIVFYYLPFSSNNLKGLSWSYGSWIYNYLCNHDQCLSPLTLWVRILLTLTLCDKVSQGLVAGRWFSPGNLLSPTNKTGRHHITEILMEVALNNLTLTLCKQWLSPLKLWVWIPLTARYVWYNIMCYSLSVTCCRLVVFPW
jgi:hypothetical protein